MYALTTNIVAPTILAGLVCYGIYRLLGNGRSATETNSTAGSEEIEDGDEEGWGWRSDVSEAVTLAVSGRAFNVGDVVVFKSAPSIPYKVTKAYWKQVDDADEDDIVLVLDVSALVSSGAVRQSRICVHETAFAKYTGHVEHAGA